MFMPYHLYLQAPDYNLRDPEGLLSTLPALGTALLGLLTGLWLRASKPLVTKARGLAAGSLACLATGYLWSIWFPLNKNLWTSSYVLVAAAGRWPRLRWPSGRPMCAAGANAGPGPGWCWDQTPSRPT
jgi:predicted acyltransferase